MNQAFCQVLQFSEKHVTCFAFPFLPLAEQVSRMRKECEQPEIPLGILQKIAGNESLTQLELHTLQLFQKSQHLTELFNGESTCFEMTFGTVQLVNSGTMEYIKKYERQVAEQFPELNAEQQMQKVSDVIEEIENQKMEKRTPAQRAQQLYNEENYLKFLNHLRKC